MPFKYVYTFLNLDNPIIIIYRNFLSSYRGVENFLIIHLNLVFLRLILLLWILIDIASHIF